MALKSFCDVPQLAYSRLRGPSRVSSLILSDNFITHFCMVKTHLYLLRFEDEAILDSNRKCSTNKISPTAFLRIEISQKVKKPRFK